MVNKEQYVVTHIDSDTADKKRGNDAALDIENMVVISENGNLSLSLIKDTISLPGQSVHKIIGFTSHNRVTYFLAYIDTGSTSHLLKIDGTNEVELLAYLNVPNTPEFTDMLINEENEEVLKLYFINKDTQLSFINLHDCVGTPSLTPEVVQPIKMSKPKVISVTDGGSQIAGKVQYGYVLFNTRGASSPLSPLSNLVSISKDMLGGASGETMLLSTEVEITGIDTTYEFIDVYSIHYQELDQTPKITQIIRREITSTSLTFVDDGTLFLEETTVADISNIGSKVIYAETLSSKNNRLFLANYSFKEFDIYEDEFDFRIYSHDISGNVTVEDIDGVPLVVTPAYDNVPIKHDCINPDTAIYKYAIGGIYGAEGINFKIEEITGAIGINKSLKQGETYRLGVIAYDKYMRKSPAKWLVDYTVQYRDDISESIGIKLSFKGDETVLAALGVVSLQLVIVERKSQDRTVGSQGFLIPGTDYTWAGYGDYSELNGDAVSDYVFPYYTTKRVIGPDAIPIGGNIAEPFTNAHDYFAIDEWLEDGSEGDSKWIIPAKRDDVCFFYSPESIFDKDSIKGFNKIRIKFVGVSAAGVGSQSASLYVKDDSLITRTDDLYAFSNRYWFKRYNATGQSSLEKVMMQYYDTTVKSIENLDVQLEDEASFLNKKSAGLVGNIKVSNIYDIGTESFLAHHGGTEDEDSSLIFDVTYNNCLALVFANDTWHQNTNPFDKFVAPVAGDSNRYLPIVELVRDLENQYGGKSYNVKKSNKYLLKGEVFLLAALATSDNFLGDITIGPFVVNTNDSENNLADFHFNVYNYVKVNNLESNIDIYSRYDEAELRFTSAIDINNYPSLYRIEDNQKYLTAYSQENKVIEAYGKPETFNTIASFKHNVIASAVKFPNELVDSWANILLNETIQVDGLYGYINKLYKFKDEIYAFQDTGVAHILIQPQVQVQTDSEVGVELGTGQILHSVKYVNTFGGTKNIKGISDDGNMLLYYNNVANTIDLLTGETLSTTKSIKNLLAKYKPTDDLAVNVIYAVDRAEFIISLQTTTLIYSTLIQAFQRREEPAEIVLPHSGSFVFHKLGNDGTTYMPYMGAAYKQGKLTYIFAPMPIADKVFHNIEYRRKGDLKLDLISVEGSLGTMSGDADPTSLAHNKFGIDRVHLPRIENSRERFRDTSIKTILTFSAQNKHSLNDMVVMFNVKG